MTHLSDSVARVRAVHATIGSKELSRRSGISYTTVRDWAARDFKPSAVKVLEVLEAAAAVVQAEGAATGEVSEVMPEPMAGAK